MIHGSKEKSYEEKGSEEKDSKEEDNEEKNNKESCKEKKEIENRRFSLSCSSVYKDLQRGRKIQSPLAKAGSSFFTLFLAEVNIK